MEHISGPVLAIVLKARLGIDPSPELVHCVQALVNSAYLQGTADALGYMLTPVGDEQDPKSGPQAMVETEPKTGIELPLSRIDQLRIGDEWVEGGSRVRLVQRAGTIGKTQRLVLHHLDGPWQGTEKLHNEYESKVVKVLN